MVEVESGARPGGKFEKHMYYRRPRHYAEQPGWVVYGASIGGSVLADKTRLGFEPLFKYGVMVDGEENPWKKILEHPDGPAEFPAEQVMTLRWYKKEDCPVPGTVFPQLQGHKVTEYQCPECNRPPFVAMDGKGAVVDLARHLRVIHSWDRASLVKYGEAVGLDFDAIYSDVQKTLEFELGEKQLPDGTLVTHGCPDCDWKPKANAKRPAFALQAHRKGHKPLEVEVA